MEILSKQENKVSHLIANGYLEKEIAHKLYISPFTVATHARNIRRKLGAKNIADITRMYILSLPKPADVFKALLFVVIQFHIAYNINVNDIDLRMARKVNIARTKIIRKQ